MDKEEWRVFKILTKSENVEDWEVAMNLLSDDPPHKVLNYLRNLKHDKYLFVDGHISDYFSLGGFRPKMNRVTALYISRYKELGGRMSIITKFLNKNKCRS